MNPINFNINEPATPCYVIDRGLLLKNLELLKSVQDRTGCKIMLALKGYAAWSTFDLCREYLVGAAASSLFEARLSKEEFRGEVHLCAPGFRPDEFDKYLEICDHIVFNSFSQWELYKPLVEKSGRRPECGLRVNPRHSEVKTAIYDPCSPGSRMGILAEEFEGKNLEGINGIHFHTLCELGSDALERTLVAVEEKFGKYLPQMDWVNFGGGHHITREDYDVDLLCRLITDFQNRYNVKVYLEPGEAVALNTGFLVSTVLDIIERDMPIAILDTSAAAHMPDVLEMPYRPHVENSFEKGNAPYCYRFAGPTCLAGDIIGKYAFNEPLKIGDRLVFHDMSIYSMVKNNMFNGINLPDIVTYDPDTDKLKLQRHFTYEDFKNRLS
ncbi:MAG: carboxynorspermidine decarboxylase [Sedimentisphaeraceae bacterium JB056]